MVNIREIDLKEPFDGVCPQDYPEVYEKLLSRSCFKQKTENRYIFDINNFAEVYCSTCYYNLEDTIVGRVVVHQRLHQIGGSQLRPLSCDNCNRTLQNTKPVISCGICTSFILQYI